MRRTGSLLRIRKPKNPQSEIEAPRSDCRVEYATGGNRFEQGIFLYSRHPLPHHRQTTIVIGMESSSGKRLQTPRCHSC